MKIILPIMTDREFLLKSSVSHDINKEIITIKIISIERDDFPINKNCIRAEIIKIS